MDRPRFDVWTDAIVAATSRGRSTDGAEAAMEMFGYFTELIERRRREPGDDTISQLARAGDDVSVLQMLGFAFTMVAGGNDTTTGLLGVALELLTEHPRPTPAAAQPHRPAAGRGRGVPPAGQPGPGAGAYDDA